MNAFDTLGIGTDAGSREVKKAYAAAIRQFRPDTHPQDFARIREAYELALRIAQSREAQQDAAQDAAQETAQGATPAPPALPDLAAAPISATPTPAPSPPPSSLPVDGTPPPRIVVPPLPSGAPADATGPSAFDPGAGVRRVHATCQQHGERLAAIELGQVLAQSASASIDERQDLETGLLRWFLSVGQPPLWLMHVAARDFDWYGHPGALRRALPAQAFDRLCLLLPLVRDLAWMREGPNALLRATFSPLVDHADVRFLAGPLRHEARRWVDAWCQRAAGLGLDPRFQLAGRPWARLSGLVLLSTDLWMGLCLAALAVGLAPGTTSLVEGGGLLAWMLGTVLLAAGCRAARATSMRWRARLAAWAPWQRARRWLDDRSLNVAAVVTMALVLGIIFSLLPGPGMTWVGYPLLALSVPPAIGGILTFAWRLLGAAEDAIANPWLDARAARHRLAFERQLAAPATSRATGRRAWGAWGAWRAWQRDGHEAREAAALAWRRGERPVYPRAVTITRPSPVAPAAATARSPGRSVHWRWWLFGAVFVLKLISLAGHR